MRDAARIPLLLVVAMVSASQEYNLTLFGNLSAPTAPLVVDGSIIVMMSLNTLQGFSTSDPAVPLWTFDMGNAFCGGSLFGTTQGFDVVRGRGTVVVSCGPYLAVLNTSTGVNVSWYTIPDGDVVSQVAVSSTYNVALVSLQSCRVFALNMTTWELLWHVNASTVEQPLVATADGDLAVVFSFTTSFNGLINCYSVVTGVKLWHTMVDMGSNNGTVLVPTQSATVFVWYGPNYASVRMLDIPTGAYHQWITDSMLQFATPTDNGLVVAVTLTRVTVINARSGVVVWSIAPKSNIAGAVTSLGGEFITLYPLDLAATSVYATDTGLPAGNCGLGQCSSPCVTRAMWSGTLVLVANCSTGGQTATLGLLDVRSTHPVGVHGPPIQVVGDPTPVNVQALTDDGLVAVSTAAGLHYVQVTRLSGTSSASSTPDSFDQPPFMLDIGVALGACLVIVSITVVVRRKRVRRAVAGIADAMSDVEYPLPRVAGSTAYLPGPPVDPVRNCQTAS